MVLNPRLYSAVASKYGKVKIVHENEEMVAASGEEALTGKPSFSIVRWGEMYEVNCPFCDDNRNRCSISYQFGELVAGSSFPSDKLWRCFNEDCQKDHACRRDLYHALCGLSAPQGGGAPPPKLTADEEEPEVGEQRFHGVVTPVTALSAGHPCVTYLQLRGFDPVEIGTRWKAGYVEQVFDRRSFFALHRLLAPVFRAGVQVGWQARALDGRKKLKYFTCPGMRKEYLLYGVDEAETASTLVVVEGYTDVWRVGPGGLATFGRSASRFQTAMLREFCPDKPLIILPDADDPKSADAAATLAANLSGRPGGVDVVHLPPGLDPAACPRDALWAYIAAMARVPAAPSI